MANDENAEVNTRPLTQTEMQVFQRHQQRRDHHVQKAQDEQNTIIELVALIGGPRAEVDLQEGILRIPKNGAGEADDIDGLGEVVADEARESGCEDCGDEGN